MRFQRIVMAYLALDLGLKTGWALRTFRDEVMSGTVNFKGKANEPPGLKFVRFYVWLANIERKHGPIRSVSYEQVMRHIGVKSAHAYGGYLAVLQGWCSRRGVICNGVHVNTIKKLVVGKGGATKQQVIEVIRELGFNPVDDNEADALAILSLIQK